MSLPSDPPTADIVLVGANAGYIHSSLALRCLLANLGPLAARARLLETDAQETTPVQFLERILALRPAVVGFSVYVWNVGFVVSVCRLLRRVAPGVALVAGGPQLVPDDPEDAVRALVDAVVCGEGEGVAEAVFGDLLSGRRNLGVIIAPPPDLAHVALPYDLYTDADLATRLVYVESTRGCPFRCDYCTSATGGGIRAFPLDRLLSAFATLLARGARHFKFLDRSFNHGGAHALAVLDFFLAALLERRVEGVGLHLEFTPDPLPDEWMERLRRFPPGALHVEVGVQTWNPEVAQRIRRPLDRDRVDAALRFLIEDARANVHADLIAGLPGDTVASLAEGFDHLVAMGPAELQFGILKRLPGTAIGRHAEAYGLVFSPEPPYEVLSTDRIPFAEMRRLARFARCWDLLHNRGRFPVSAPLFWADAASPFARVMALADWLQARHGRLHALAPKRLADGLLDLTPEVRRSALRIALERDARDRAGQGITPLEV